MITRQDLNRILQINNRLKRDRGQVAYLRGKATSLQSFNEGDRVAVSRVSDITRYMDAIVDLEKAINEDEQELKEIQGRAKTVFEGYSDRLTKRVMCFRYLQCLTIEEVAELAGYSERQVYRVIETQLSKMDY